MSGKTDISLRKRFLFALAAVALVWLGMELSFILCLWLLPVRAMDLGSSSLYQGHPYRAYAPAPGRVSRKGDVSFNSMGMRGPDVRPVKSSDTIRIVCIGGSTTVSYAATTNTHTWPARMERLLNARYGEAPFRVEVLNAGVEASVALESLIFFQTRILDLQPDVVVFLHALNDAVLMVRFPNFQSDYSHARRPFSVPPRAWWEYSAILSFCFSRSTLSNPYGFGRDVNLLDVILVRPDIFWNPAKAVKNELDSAMLAAFERNLRSFLAVARGNGVIPIFATEVYEPMAPSDPLGNLIYRSGEMLNRLMRDTAASASAAVIDFAVAMPWSEAAFYDDCHMIDSPEGLGRKAEIFAEALAGMGVLEHLYNRRLQRQPLEEAETRRADPYRQGRSHTRQKQPGRGEFPGEDVRRENPSHGGIP